jgi:hypothetical protein
MPQPPTQVLEPLTLLKIASNFGTNLPSLCERLGIIEVAKGYEGLVALRMGLVEKRMGK